MLEVGVYNKDELRLTVEGMLYRMRVGCPWRDVPEFFGNWNSIYKRFQEWSLNGKLEQIFYELSSCPDLEWQFIDGSIVSAHQHSMGARKGEETAIGKSVAGNSSKIHLATDSEGLALVFDVIPGNQHEVTHAPEFFETLPEAEYRITDRGYDCEELRELTRAQGIIPVMPRKKNSLTGNHDIDWCLYKYRHLVENAFARLKHFRAIATRYDKLKYTYIGMITWAAIICWLPM